MSEPVVVEPEAEEPEAGAEPASAALHRHLAIGIAAVAVVLTSTYVGLQLPRVGRPTEATPSLAGAHDLAASDPSAVRDFRACSLAWTRRSAGAAGGDARVGFVPIGTVALPTGRIVVSAPFYGDEPALDVPLAPGSYPVEVVVARFGENEPVACAGVAVSQASIARWEPARPSSDAVVPSEEAPPASGEGRPAAVPEPAAAAAEGYLLTVEAGTGSFMDASAARALDRREHDEPEAWNAYVGEVARLIEAGQSGALVADSASGANVVLFSAGAGDGSYPVLVGYAADGAVAAILTDFGVLDADRAAEEVG